MSTSIENHVVRMEFENKSFEKNASQTMDTVQNLKDNLKFEGASKGLEQLSHAVKKVDTTGLSKGAEEAQNKFSTLGIVGATVLFRLTNAAIDVGKKIASALTLPINQIKTGGWSRAMNLEQAKFQLKGMQMDVEAVMKDVGFAVDGTAYSLDAAAKAAATLGASGVKAGQQVGGLAHALRGVSGVAAMTNSDYESIAQIFATVAGNGKLMTMQLRQLSARGMNAAATLAEAMDTSEAAIYEMVSKGKISFQDFSEAMYNAFGDHAIAANETFTGALANIKSALSRVGETFATPIIQQAVPVFNAIRTSINEINTEIKSLWGNSTRFGKAISGPFEQLAKAVSGALTAYFSSNNFIEAGKSVARGISNIFLTILDLIDAVRSAWLDVFPSDGPASGTRRAAEGFESLTKTLRTFVNMVIPPLKSGLKIIFSILKTVIGVVKGLYHALEPVFTTLKLGLVILANVATYLGNLVVSAIEAVDVGGIMAKVFNVVKTVLELAAVAVIILVNALFKLNNQFPIFTYLGKGIQTVAGAIGMLVKGAVDLLSTPIDQWGAKFSGIVGKIKEFFSSLLDIPIVGTIIEKLGSAIQVIGSILGKVVNSVKNYTLSVINFFSEMLNAFKEKGIGGVVDYIIKKFTELKNTISNFVGKGLSFLFGKDIQANASGFMGILGGIVTKIQELAKGIDAGTIAVTAFTGAFIALIIGVAKSAFAIAGLFRSLSGVAGAIKSIFTGAIRQDRPIVSAAKAIFLFSAALLALSYVDVEKLPKIARALTGMVLVLGGLTAVMGLIGRIRGVEAGLRAMSANMLAMSLSIGILTASLIGLTTALNGKKWEDVDVAIGAMLALATGIGVIVTIISRFSPDMFKGGLSLLLFAISIDLVIKRLESINVTGLEKFSNGIALGLAGLAAALALATPVIKSISNAAKGIGLAAAGIAVAITLLAHTANFIQKQNWNKDALLKALGFIGTLIILFGAISLVNTYITTKNTKGGDKRNKFSKSGGIVGMILSLTVAVALLSGLAVLIAKVPTETLIKGLITVGSVIVLFGTVITIINKSAQGLNKDAAIIIASVTISIVALIGEMIALTFVPWDKLLKAVAALATVMVTFGLAVKATMKYGQNVNSKGIINFIAVLGSMVVVAGIMIELSKYDLDWKKIAAIGVSLSATMVAFGLAVQIISKSGNIGANAFDNFIPILLSMIAVAGIMAGLAYLNVDWKTIAASGLSMAATMVAFGAACKLISGFKLDKSELVNLLGVIGIMTLIGLGLAFLSQFNWDGLLASGLSLAATMLAFGAACKLISGFQIDKSQLLGILASMGIMTLVLLAIAGISKIYDTVSWESLLKGGASLIVFAGIIVAFSLLMKNVKLQELAANLGSLLAMSVILFVIAGALVVFENISWESIGKGIISLIALAGALTLMCRVGGGGSGMLLSAAALAIMGVSLGIIALALKQFEGVGWEALGKAGLVLIVLAGALMILSTATMEGVGTVLVAAGLIILAGALILLAPALSSLTKIGGGTILGTLAGLGAGLLVVGIGAALLLIGVAGLFGFAIALNDLIPLLLMLKTINNSGELLAGLAGGIIAMMGAELVSGAGYGWLKKDFVPALNAIVIVLKETPSDAGKRLEEMASGIIAMMAAEEAVKSFSALDIIAALKVIETITQMLPAMAMAVRLAISLLNKAIVDELAQLPNLVTRCFAEIGNQIESGMANLAKLAYSSTEAMSAQIEPGFRAGVHWFSPMDWLNEFGIDLDDQLSGIFENSDWLASASTSFAENGIHIPLVNSLTSTLVDVKTLANQISAEITRIAGLNDSVQNRHEERLKKDENYARRYGQMLNRYEKDTKNTAKIIDGIFKDQDKKNKIYESNRKRAIDEWILQNNDLTDVFGDLSDGMDESTKSALDFSDALDGISGGGGGGSAGEAKKSIEETTDALEKFIEKTKEAVKNGISIFDEFDKKTELTGKKLLENMRSQITGVAEWANKLTLLANRGIDQGLLAELSQLGPAGYEKVNAFTQMTAEELAEANNLWNQSLMLPNAITKQLADSWQVSGQMMISGLTLGLQKDEGAATQITQTSNKLLSLFNTAWGIASPSAVMEKEGYYIMEGLRIGLRENLYLVENTIEKIDKKLFKKMKGMAKHMIEGFEDGITENLSHMLSTVQEMANQVAEAVAQALEIASPSRVMVRMGKYFDEGLAVGITKYSHVSEKAAAELGNNTLLGVQTAITALSDYINGDGPVIKPILDLTDVMNEAKKLDTEFNPYIRASKAGTYDKFGNSVNEQNPVVNNFTQNNYSPKSLSRLEIYRQTKNLIGRVNTAKM